MPTGTITRFFMQSRLWLYNAGWTMMETTSSLVDECPGKLRRFKVVMEGTARPDLTKGDAERWD